MDDVTANSISVTMEQTISADWYQKPWIPTHAFVCDLLNFMQLHVMPILIEQRIITKRTPPKEIPMNECARMTHTLIRNLVAPEKAVGTTTLSLCTKNFPGIKLFIPAFFRYERELESANSPLALGSNVQILVAERNEHDLETANRGRDDRLCVQEYWRIRLLSGGGYETVTLMTNDKLRNVNNQFMSTTRATIYTKNVEKPLVHTYAALKEIFPDAATMLHKMRVFSPIRDPMTDDLPVRENMDCTPNHVNRVINCQAAHSMWQANVMDCRVW